MKKLGILGGMGPLAGACFFHRMTEMTEASCDAEHPTVFLLSLPFIPDRTAHLTGNGPSPLPLLCRGVRFLENQGAEGILIPCNTAFAYYRPMSEHTGAHILHMPRLAVSRGAAQGARALGLLGTSGCVSAEVYQRPCEEKGIRLLLPSQAEQGRLDRLIYRRKAGEDIPAEAYFPCIEKMLLSGADRVILGCTEISLSFRGKTGGGRLIDPLDELAKAALRFAGCSCRSKERKETEIRREVKRRDLSRALVP